MKIAFAILIALSMLGLRLAAATNPIGTYTCSGTQRGERYQLSLDVREYGDTYEFAWTEPNQPPALVGLAVPAGDHLAVAIVGGNGAIGVAHYTVSPGRLDGIWTSGNGGLDTEVCTSKAGKAA